MTRVVIFLVFLNINNLKLPTSSLSGHEKDADLGPVITPQAKERVERLITSGEKEGVNIMLDGRGLTVPGYEKGNFVGPTVLHGVEVRDRLFFRVVKTTLSSSYNISGLVPVCWLLFQCFD